MDYFLKYIFNYEFEDVLKLSDDTQKVLLECALNGRDISYRKFFKQCIEANVSLADNPNCIDFYKLFDSEYDGQDDYAEDFIKLFGNSGKVFNLVMNELMEREDIILICQFLNNGNLQPSAEIADLLLDLAEDYYENDRLSLFDTLYKDLFKKSADILINAGYITEDDLSGEVWKHCFDIED